MLEFRKSGSMLAGATLTGILYYLAFPNVDAWPFAFVAWVPWLLVLRGAPVGSAALSGIAVGLTIGVLGFPWLFETLQAFSGFSSPICVLLTFVLLLYQSGRFVLLGWLYSRGQARGWPAGGVFFCAFVASETLFPLILPFAFGTTMHTVRAIAQAADIGGSILVSLIVLSPNWAIFLGLRHWWDSGYSTKNVNAPRVFARPPLRCWLLLLVPLLASGYGLLRIEQLDRAVTAAEKLRVGIVQANIPVDGRGAGIENVLQTHLRLSRQLVQDQDVQLVVWSEKSVSGATHEKRSQQHYERNVVRFVGAPVILGADLWQGTTSEDLRVFNSALLANGDGKIAGRYDKQRLLLFGERLPFDEQLPGLRQRFGSSEFFSAGDYDGLLVLEGREIAISICFEDIIPDHINSLMKHGTPELLVNITNDAWFGDTSEPWEHLADAKFRAIEQRRFFVRSANTGISAFIDPTGRLVKSTLPFEETAIASEVAWLKIGTLFQVWGNRPWEALSLLAVALAFLRRRAR